MFIRRYSDYLLGHFRAVDIPVGSGAELNSLSSSYSIAENAAKDGKKVEAARQTSYKYLVVFYNLARHWQTVEQKLQMRRDVKELPVFLDISRVFPTIAVDSLDTGLLVSSGYYALLRKGILAFSSKWLLECVSVMRESFLLAKNSHTFNQDKQFMTSCNDFLEKAKVLPSPVTVSTLIALIEPFYPYFLTVKRYLKGIKPVYFEDVLQLQSFMILLRTRRFEPERRAFKYYASRVLRVISEVSNLQSSAVCRIATLLDDLAPIERLTPTTDALEKTSKDRLQTIFALF